MPDPVLRGTDVETPGEGCVFLELEGSYETPDPEKILARLNEIRLEVRASNFNAIRTYTRLGFVRIAYRTDGVVTDGVAEDVWLMSLDSREIRTDGLDRREFFGRFPKTGFRFKPER